jgi:hypothetical protein
MQARDEGHRDTPHAFETLEFVHEEDERIGRGERIRTSDTCVPNAVLYQAELHPELRSGVQ